MAKKRSQNVKTREFHVDTISEAETRKRYIDVALKEAGWVIGRNATEEEPVTGMPNSTGTGYVDYGPLGKGQSAACSCGRLKRLLWMLW